VLHSTMQLMKCRCNGNRTRIAGGTPQFITMQAPMKKHPQKFVSAFTD